MELVIYFGGLLVLGAIAGVAALIYKVVDDVAGSPVWGARCPVCGAKNSLVWTGFEEVVPGSRREVDYFNGSDDNGKDASYYTYDIYEDFEMHCRCRKCNQGTDQRTETRRAFGGVRPKHYTPPQ